MSKKCDICGQFMALTNLLPDDDEFDEALAIECGITDDELRAGAWRDTENKWSRFVYVQDQWECSNCQTTLWHTEGPRYWWNPASGNYDGQRPKAPKDRAIEAARRLEATGQMRLFD